MKIYLAARYSRREELCRYAEDLRSLGHEVTSRWLAGDHQIDDAGLSVEGAQEERVRFATEDWNDLVSASCCISFTEAPRSSNSRGGRHVEFGAALGIGLECIVVGPRENVFHCLPEVRVVAEWPQALEYLRRRGDSVASCLVCGCTDDDCSGCVERTGEPCRWVEPDLCSACQAQPAAVAP